MKWNSQDLNEIKWRGMKLNKRNMKWNDTKSNGMKMKSSDMNCHDMAGNVMKPNGLRWKLKWKLIIRLIILWNYFITVFMKWFHFIVCKWILRIKVIIFVLLITFRTGLVLMSFIIFVSFFTFCFPNWEKKEINILIKKWKFENENLRHF